MFKSTLKPGVWVNGKKRLTGLWTYNRGSDTFSIFLDSTDRITGEQRTIITHEDKPEWGNWKYIPV